MQATDMTKKHTLTQTHTLIHTQNQTHTETQKHRNTDMSKCRADPTRGGSAKNIGRV